MGHHFSADGRDWAVVVSDDAIISQEVRDTDTLVIDGNADHLLEDTLLSFGVVHNAQRDVSHRYRVLAFGVASGKETPASVTMFLRLVAQHRDKTLEG